MCLCLRPMLLTRSLCQEAEIPKDGAKAYKAETDQPLTDDNSERFIFWITMLFGIFFAYFFWTSMGGKLF